MPLSLTDKLDEVIPTSSIVGSEKDVFESFKIQSRWGWTSGGSVRLSPNVSILPWGSVSGSVLCGRRYYRIGPFVLVYRLGGCHDVWTNVPGNRPPLVCL